MAILINDTAPRAQYTATSGQTVFTVSFEFFANSDLKVYRNATLLTLTTNYTVTGAGVTGGGSVTFVTGATAGDIVTIIRDVPVARTSDFPTSGPFNIEALNTDLDRLTAMVQQQETLDGRSLRLDQFDTPNTLNVLPVKASRVGRVLQFNDTTGQPEAGPTTSEISNAQTYATNASTSATAAAASAATSSSAAASTASNVAAAAASASAASTSATNSASSASAASTSASNASTSASNASTSATAAAGSASTASTQASNAASSASAASTSASNAATSASNAASAQTAAESARDATLAAYDNFDDRYLGAKASNPSVDNDGNALVAGALYFNSVAGEMRLYTGSSWVAAYVSGAGFLALSGGTMTGTANFVAGSDAAPGIAASGNTNTGIFFPAANTIAFAEGGFESMRLDSSRNALIGTSATRNRLTVSGTTVATPTLGTASGTTFFCPADNTYGTMFGTGGSGDGWIQQQRVDGTASAYNLLLQPVGGNVGIGTSSPNFSGYGTTNLTVSGGTTIQGVLELVGTRADASGAAAGDVNFFANSNGAGNKRIAAIQALTDGSTATNRGGALVFNAKADGGSLSERFRIASAGQFGIGGANYGTSGQVLTSGGAAAAPSWASPAAGGQIQSQTFTANGTWTAPTGVTKVRAFVFGGGGGNFASGCGAQPGGNGGYAVGVYTVVPGTGYAITVGTGGTGVTSGTAVAGGTSSFASFASATGGGGAIGSIETPGANGSGSNGNIRNSEVAYSTSAIIQGFNGARTTNNTTLVYSATNNAYIGIGGQALSATRAGATGAVYLEWVG